MAIRDHNEKLENAITREAAEFFLRIGHLRLPSGAS